jgi:hypothetical protein
VLALRWMLFDLPNSTRQSPAAPLRLPPTRERGLVSKGFQKRVPHRELPPHKICLPGAVDLDSSDRQDRQRGSRHDLADADDGLAIEAIRNMPDDEGEQEHRKKLRQPHHA